MSIAIRYVGKKEQMTDHLYGTGITWNGAGDVQDVPEDKAPLLLHHTDVWADARPAAARKKNPVGKAVDDVPRYRDSEEIITPAVKVHLMPLEDLGHYAFTHFGERLDPGLTVEQARGEVVRLMHTRG